MTYGDFRLLQAVERFVKERGLEGNYRRDNENCSLVLRFRDRVDKQHQAECIVAECVILETPDLEDFAWRIVDDAADKIGKQKAQAKAVYITTGRGSGKTLLDECFRSGYLTMDELNYVHNYIKNNIERINNMITKNSIKDVIFNPPATIVMWKDGSKTVVKAQNDETFDPEKGLAMAIAKKALGNQGNYFETIKKYTETYKPVKQKVLSDIPKSESERWGVYIDGYGWVKGRKYVRVNGKKVFDHYTFTNNESEALTWKTKVGADGNAVHLFGARAVHMK